MPLFLTAAWAFIKRLNLSQIALAIALAFAAMQTVKLGIERRHSAKLQSRVNELVALVEGMTTQQDTQTKVTEGNVKRVEVKRNPVAEQIEAAPVAEGCKTPGVELGRAEL